MSSQRHQYLCCTGQSTQCVFKQLWLLLADLLVCLSINSENLIIKLIRSVADWWCGKVYPVQSSLALLQLHEKATADAAAAAAMSKMILSAKHVEKLKQETSPRGTAVNEILQTFHLAH